MADDKLINSVDAAELIGVSSAYLVKWFGWLDGFPAGVKTPSRAWLFPRRAVIRWAKARDVKAEFVAAKQRRALTRCGPERFNRMAALFLSGRCIKRVNDREVVVSALSTAAREALEFRKLTARTLKPSTTRVRVVPDWVREDDDDRSAA